MKTSFLGLALLILLGSCSKSKDTDPNITICIGPPYQPDWLIAKKSEYASCTCLTEFRSGIYNNTQVFEIRTIDPLCNGIQVVYKPDGTVLLNSADTTAYQHYLTNVKDLTVFWTCAKSNK